MAVVSVKSTSITNFLAVPRVLDNPYRTRGSDKLATAIAAVANGDSIASQYSMFLIPSDANLRYLAIRTTGVASASAKFGLMRLNPNSGVLSTIVANSDGFFTSVGATGIAITAASLPAIDILYGTANPITNAEKRLWEALGLTVDPNEEWAVVMTLVAAATGAGTVQLEADFVI